MWFRSRPTAAMAILSLALSAPAMAQNPVPKNLGAVDPAKQSIITVFQDTDLDKDPSRFVRLQQTIFPAGGGNGFHTHPGDQYFAVLEGEMVYTVKGQPPRLMKAGDSVHIPRGVIHKTENLSHAPAKLIELNIFDRDQPFFSAVAP